tara:strand:+ start:377 stop:574 length:198 start_codon:yes stop_codon:yes gene_type:complete
MSQQSDKARASVTSLTPEPEFSKSGIPLHMMSPLQIEEEIPASDMPDPVEKFDEDISLEEALSTL